MGPEDEWNWKQCNFCHEQRLIDRGIERRERVFSCPCKPATCWREMARRECCGGAVQNRKGHGEDLLIAESAKDVGRYVDFNSI